MKLLSGRIRIFFVAVLALFMGIIASISPRALYAETSYDFARKGDVAYSTLTAADIISAYVGEISETERSYLEKNDTFKVSYSNSISASYVTESFDGNSLSVSADEYIYTAVNGEQVRWQPSRAYVGGKQMTTGGNAWTAEIGDIDGDTVTVEYTYPVTVLAADVNGFLNKTFDAGLAASQKIKSENERYQAELTQYDADYQKYQTYLSDLAEYDMNFKEYEKYLADYAAWKRAYDEYAQYATEYEQYLKELDEYNNYDAVLKRYYEDLAAYRQYLSDYKDYEAALEDYYKSIESTSVQTAMYHLSILDYLTKPVNLNRTISGAILGDSVTQVLAQTEALVLAGAERAAVEKANAATVALRSLLSSYEKLSTNQEKYAFYISCYESLKENFNVLLRTLDYFYGFSAIRAAIGQYNATDKYEILIAQLYYICNALDDSRIANYVQAYKYDKTDGGYFDSLYRIGPNKKTPSSLVGEGNTLEDKNSGAPLSSGYVEIPVMPTEPDKVDNPGGIPEHRKPTAPEVVANPGNAPSEVAEPTMPNEVAEPTMPIAYVPSAEEAELSKAYESGLISERKELTSDYTLTLTAQVIKYFRNAKVSTLRFYADISQTEPLYTVDALVGSYVEYPHELPTKTRTGYTCTFDCWQDENGNKVDLNRLQTDKGDLSLYPHFAEVANLYSVHWYINGTRIDDECAYDSSPYYDEVKHNVALTKSPAGARLYRFTGWKDNGTGEFYGADEPLPLMTTTAKMFEAVFEQSYIVEWVVDGNSTQTAVWANQIPTFTQPQKAHDNYFSYTFTGWDKEITPASADVIYTAMFNKEYLCGYGNSGGKVTEVDGVITADCMASPAMRFNIGNMITLAALESKAVEIKLPSSTLLMSGASVYSAYEQGVFTAVISAVTVAPKTYKYSLLLLDRDGNLLTVSDINVTIMARGDYDASNSYLTATDILGNVSDVRFTITDNSVSFALKPGLTYNLIPQYAIGVIVSEFVTVSPSVKRAEAGETVEIVLSDLKSGMYVSSVYAVDTTGNDIDISDLSFVMPRNAVTIGVVCSYYEYTVTFKSDGKVLFTQKLKHGEQIAVPADPIKPSDGEYQYTFAGWDGELGAITKDTEFNALFTKSPLPELPQKDSKLNKLIKAAYVVVPVVLVLITGLVVFLVIRKKRKNKKNNLQE